MIGKYRDMWARANEHIYVYYLEVEGHKLECVSLINNRFLIRNWGVNVIEIFLGWVTAFIVHIKL